MVTYIQIMEDLNKIKSDLQSGGNCWKAYRSLRTIISDPNHSETLQRREIILDNDEPRELFKELYSLSVEIMANTLIGKDKELVGLLGDAENIIQLIAKKKEGGSDSSASSSSTSISRSRSSSSVDDDVVTYYQNVMNFIHNDFANLKSLDECTLAYEQWIRVAHRCLHHPELSDINMMICIIEGLMGALGGDRISEITPGISTEAFEMAIEMKGLMHFDRTKMQYPKLQDKMSSPQCIPYVKLFLNGVDPTIANGSVDAFSKIEKINTRFKIIRDAKFLSTQSKEVVRNTSKVIKKDFSPGQKNSKIALQKNLYATNQLTKPSQDTRLEEDFKSSMSALREAKRAVRECENIKKEIDNLLIEAKTPALTAEARVEINQKYKEAFTKLQKLKQITKYSMKDAVYAVSAVSRKFDKFKEDEDISVDAQYHAQKAIDRRQKGIEKLQKKNAELQKILEISPYASPTPSRGGDDDDGDESHLELDVDDNSVANSDSSFHVPEEKVGFDLHEPDLKLLADQIFAEQDGSILSSTPLKRVNAGLYAMYTKSDLFTGVDKDKNIQLLILFLKELDKINFLKIYKFLEDKKLLVNGTPLDKSLIAEIRQLRQQTVIVEYQKDEKQSKVKLRDALSASMHHMVNYEAIGKKIGGANDSGEKGGIYQCQYVVRILDGATIVSEEVRTQKILFKKDGVLAKNICEYVAGQIMNELVGDSAASVFLAKDQEYKPGDDPTDESGEHTYIGSIFYDDYRDLWEQLYDEAGKPLPESRPRFVNTFSERAAVMAKIQDPKDPTKCIYSNFADVVISKLLVQDYDAHWGNFGVCDDVDLVGIDHGGALWNLTHEANLHKKLPPVTTASGSVSTQPTNHFLEYPRPLKINIEFAKRLVQIATHDRQKLRLRIHAALHGNVSANYGDGPIKDFALRLGVDPTTVECMTHGENGKPLDSASQKTALLDGIESFLVARMEARLDSCLKLASEIKLSLCIPPYKGNTGTYSKIDIREQPYYGKPTEACEGFNRLIEEDPYYLLKGVYHFRGEGQRMQIHEVSVDWPIYTKRLHIAVKNKVVEKIDAFVEKAVRENNPRILEYIFDNKELCHRLRKANKLTKIKETYDVMLLKIAKSDYVDRIDLTADGMRSLADKVSAEILSEPFDGTLDRDPNNLPNIHRLSIIKRWVKIFKLAKKDNPKTAVAILGGLTSPAILRLEKYIQFTTALDLSRMKITTDPIIAAAIPSLPKQDKDKAKYELNASKQLEPTRSTFENQFCESKMTDVDLIEMIRCNAFWGSNTPTGIKLMMGRLAGHDTMMPGLFDQLKRIAYERRPEGTTFSNPRNNPNSTKMYIALKNSETLDEFLRMSSVNELWAEYRQSAHSKEAPRTISTSPLSRFASPSTSTSVSATAAASESPRIDKR